MKKRRKKEVKLNLARDDKGVYSFSGYFEHHLFAGIVLGTEEAKKRKSNEPFIHSSFIHFIKYLLSTYKCPWT